ncbi:MAG: hypothetical protein GY750_01900 [Lentisphaerae bacterium]|nr:hypothetical protein [Lentisphaerota bacterium]MCP4100174.1 hypothetical protein [Lentisphaerota bacterium]
MKMMKNDDTIDETWKNGSIYDMVIAPTGDPSNRTLYATYYYSAEVMPKRRIGVYKSTDGGKNWVEKNNGLKENKNTLAIAIHPTDPNIIYVCVKENNYLTEPKWDPVKKEFSRDQRSGYIAKSTNGGDSWTVVLGQKEGGTASIDPRSIAINPTDPNIIYVGHSDFSSKSKQQLFWKSTDGGSTWTYKMATTFNNQNNPLNAHFYRPSPDPNNPKVIKRHILEAITPDPNIPDRVYIGFREYNNDYGRGNGLWYSDDYGETWNCFEYKGMGVFRISDIFIDPTDNTRLYVTTGGAGVWRWGKAPEKISLWEFDEVNVSTVQDAIGENNAALHGAPTLVSGKIGNAVELDGVDDYINCGNDPSLNIGKGSFTVSAWIYPHQLNGSDENNWPNMNDNMLFSKYQDANNFYYLRFRDADIIQFYGKIDGTMYCSQGLLAPGIDFNAGSWYMATFVIDRAKQKLKVYYNDILAGTFNFTTPIHGIDFSNEGDFTIGACNGIKHFDGLIDDFKVYNYAIGLREVQKMYGTVGHWKMEFMDNEELFDSIYSQFIAPSEGITLVNGKNGKAASFNGVDGYINLGQNEALSVGTGDFAVSAWIFPNELNGAESNDWPNMNDNVLISQLISIISGSEMPMSFSSTEK